MCEYKGGWNPIPTIAPKEPGKGINSKVSCDTMTELLSTVQTRKNSIKSYSLMYGITIQEVINRIKSEIEKSSMKGLQSVEVRKIPELFEREINRQLKESGYSTN